MERAIPKNWRQLSDTKLAFHLNDSQSFCRFARRLGELFRISCRRPGLNWQSMALSAAGFRRPGEEKQLDLFPG